LAKHILGRALA